MGLDINAHTNPHADGLCDVTVDFTLVEKLKSLYLHTSSEKNPHFDLKLNLNNLTSPFAKYLSKINVSQLDDYFPISLSSPESTSL